jgi:Leucine-rich repeat (LRR) protein
LVFPKDLSGLSSLQFLNLSRNKIEIIPGHVIQMTSLIHMDLWENLILLPEEIKQLKNLNYLDLRGVSMFRENMLFIIKCTEI